MADKFDPYREALILETNTVWPAGLPAVDPSRREAIEQQLHREPQLAAELAYLRLYTGFAREITVTVADLERLGIVPASNPAAPA